MNTATLDRDRFVQNNITTQLNYLATHLEQMRSLILINADLEVINLMRESRYYIEWIVPQLVGINVEVSAELVDFGRVLTRWLYDWEKLRANINSRCEVAQIAAGFCDRIREISSMA
ncbi:MAG: hypothetical protein HC903_12670 [Methylacidiphilales bacterium]|nr:hypothetical protein [Candidatus Methylacidiphilales bacterium]NJR18072.1 hypothetical protein [Calothrix sp. CSU_2_0]